DHGQRVDYVRYCGRCEQRDHPAVRVADKMCAVADHLCDEAGVLLEVDVGDWRIGWESRPPHHLELEAGAELALPAPGGAATHDAAVDEDDSRRRVNHVTNLVVFGSTRRNL